ncbi:MAG: (2Fe-2S)-binding protein [Acidobacteriia bacterium]|nr:(2Fe-2S)-binding protein [Terriglobia bacterium]
MKIPIQVTINGEERNDEIEPRLLLIHYIRDVVGLKGPHIGCETSICGSCTIELNGKIVKSCSLLAIQADGQDIVTVEGLSNGDTLHPVQEAFWNEHGLQCGFCTPGMLMTVKDILTRNPNPTDQEIRTGLEGNLCRCTGYQHIVNAVKTAASKMEG